MANAKADDPPMQFDSWEQCRDYFAMEAMFLMQLADWRPTKANKRRARNASRLAMAANKKARALAKARGEGR